VNYRTVTQRPAPSCPVGWLAAGPGTMEPTPTAPKPKPRNNGIAAAADMKNLRVASIVMNGQFPFVSRPPCARTT
jgi:hypothetical protein